MAQEGRQDLWTFEAHVDLNSSHEYLLATVSAGGVASLAVAGTAPAFVLAEAHIGVASLVIGGVTKVRLGATLAPFVRVAAGAGGKAVAAAAGDHVAGILLAGGDEDEYVAILVAPSFDSDTVSAP